MGPACRESEARAKNFPISHWDSVSLPTVALAGANRRRKQREHQEREHRIQRERMIMQLVARPICPGEKNSVMQSEF
jgi:hypothetical protein